MEELIQKIMLKAYLVNKNTKHTVFLNFSGHVEWLEMQIYINGWEEGEKFGIEMRVKLYKKGADIKLEKMLKKLERLLENI